MTLQFDTTQLSHNPSAGSSIITKETNLSNMERDLPKSDFPVLNSDGRLAGTKRSPSPSGNLAKDNDRSPTKRRIEISKTKVDGATPNQSILQGGAGFAQMPTMPRGLPEGFSSPSSRGLMGPPLPFTRSEQGRRPQSQLMGSQSLMNDASLVMSAGQRRQQQQQQSQREDVLRQLLSSSQQGDSQSAARALALSRAEELIGAGIALAMDSNPNASVGGLPQLGGSGLGSSLQMGGRTDYLSSLGGLQGLPFLQSQSLRNPIMDPSALLMASGGNLGAGRLGGSLPPMGLGMMSGAMPSSNLLSGMQMPQGAVPGMNQKSVDLYIHGVDDEVLSDHQILLRQQIELFAATAYDIRTMAPGRRRDIKVGQVGIRCKHCAKLPPQHHTRGSVYFPSHLRALYQAAQNMAVSHFCSCCTEVSEGTKQRLIEYQASKAKAGYGGKTYWADAAKARGVYETEDGLRFKDTESSTEN